MQDSTPFFITLHIIVLNFSKFFYFSYFKLLELYIENKQLKNDFNYKVSRTYIQENNTLQYLNKKYYIYTLIRLY